MSCEIKIPPVEGLEENILTVGRIFHLQCTADIQEGFDFSKAHFELQEKNKLFFKVLKVASQDQKQLSIEATLYGTGEWKIENLILTDGVMKIPLGKFEAQVQSVIPEGIKAEPLGPIGPLKIPVPWLYIFILIAILLVLFGIMGARIRRRWQRSSLLNRLREYETPLTALQQFHAESRRWQRENSFFHDFKTEDASAKKVLEEINRQVRIFFIRRFQIPALDWNEKLILADLKKNHSKIFAENHLIIRKWYTEMSKVLAAKTSFKAQDIIQLHNEARKMLEKLDRDLEGAQ